MIPGVYLFEKAWTYAFTDVVNNYFWVMLVLLPALALLLLILAFSKETRKSKSPVSV